MGKVYIVLRDRDTNELKHYGVLGMKWGVHRYRDPNGSLTAKGKAKYRPDRLAGNIGRALSNTSGGQRIIGVGINKGYRQDKKEIKTSYKKLKENYKKNPNKVERKEQIKTLKSDYKKTKGEARITAANALYPWQKSSTNTKIQTQNFGKQFAKSMLAGGYGTLNYDRLSANDTGRGASAIAGLLSGAGDNLVSGLLSVGDYVGNREAYKRTGKSVSQHLNSNIK